MRCENCMQQMQTEQYPCPHCGYQPDPDAQNEKYLMPGTKVGQYELGRVLGAGGFGITYLGWDNNLQRRVAIKEYFPSNLSTRIPGHTEISVFTGEKAVIFQHGLQRFLEEARLLMRFSGQKGIVSIYDVLEENGTAYIVMEYLEGITMKQHVAQFGVMNEEQLLQCMIPAILTLKFLHQDGYIHRDIAPDNIMYLPDGSIKLLDFGAARYAVMEASQTLSVIVKQGFTPIEQYQSHGKQGPWTDVYAVGATMYYALTGKVPLGALERLNHDTLKSPLQMGAKVSPQVSRAIMAALNVQPEERPQNLDSLIAALLGQEEPPVIQHRRKLPLPAILGLVAAAVIMTGSVIGIAANQSAKAPKADLDGVSVPNIIGKQIEDASSTLQNQQLSLMITGGRFYDEALVDSGFVSVDQVMTQDPESGISVEINSIVGAEVSKGKAQAYMPDITDMLLENAIGEMENAGFDADSVEIETQERDDLMPGTVISQETEAGQHADYDAPQHLVVSTAPAERPESPEPEPAEFMVEDYKGQDFDTLRDMLLSHRIYLVKSASVYSETAPVGTVISQYPEPNTVLHPGEAVYVVVSKGIERTHVPDVQFLPLNEAKKELIESGLTWEITYIFNPELADNLVASQDLAPHTQVDFGDVVHLEVNHSNPPAAGAAGPAPALDPTDLTISVGETYQLNVLYEGSEGLYWASSDESIVSVDQDGNLSPLRLGMATVIVGADNQLAFCKVTVEDEAIVLRMSRALTEGDTLDCAQELSRRDHVSDEVIRNLIWRTSDPDILTVSEDGKATGVKPGFGVVIGVNTGHIYQFSIMVEEEIQTVTVQRSEVEETLSQAEKALEEAELAYEVKREYSNTVPKDNIIRIKYTGQEDAENYYVVKDTTVTLVVSNGRNKVEKLEISKNPTKMSYKIGEKPNYSGMELKATYSDGTTNKITSGYTAPTNALTADNRTVTISYAGKSVTLRFNIQADATLQVITKPAKTVYYIGDTLNLEGLKLRYTGKDGKTNEVTSGYTHSADLSAAGSCTVTVSYENVSTSFSVTVKTPSITATMTQEGGFTALHATTDPAGQKYTWSVVDPTQGYFTADGMLVPLKTCTITVAATMIYNGKSYSDTLTFFVTAEKEYEFEIVETHHASDQNEGYWSFSVQSNLPDFNADNIKWQMVPIPEWFITSIDGDGIHIIGEYVDTAQTFTVQATYFYNGTQYQDSVSVSVPARKETYSFDISAVLVQNTSIQVTVSTTIPGFDLNAVKWSVSGLPDTNGWGKNNTGIFVDVFGLAGSNTPYTIDIFASYTYNGETYSSSASVTI